MRVLTILAIAIFATSCAEGPTSKERLASLTISAPPIEKVSGEEFKKLVMGNTLYRELTTRRGRYLEYMFHFINDDKLLFSSGRSAPTQEQEWSVSDDGRFCYIHTYRRTRESCWDVLRFDGNAFITKSHRGREERLLLLKGKHSI